MAHHRFRSVRSEPVGKELKRRCKRSLTTFAGSLAFVELRLLKHLSDENLILAAEAELDADRQVVAELHVEVCEQCRSRQAVISGRIKGFSEVRRQALLIPEAG